MGTLENVFLISYCTITSKNPKSWIQSKTSNTPARTKSTLLQGSVHYFSILNTNSVPKSMKVHNFYPHNFFTVVVELIKLIFTSHKTKLTVEIGNWRIARSNGGHELPARLHQTKKPLPFAKWRLGHTQVNITNDFATSTCPSRFITSMGRSSIVTIAVLNLQIKIIIYQIL